MSGLLTTFRPERGSRLLGVVVLLAVCVLFGDAAHALPGTAVGTAASAISSIPSSVSEVALPTALAPMRGLMQFRASGAAFGAVLAVVCCLWAQTLLRGWASDPPRAAPGRRGRASLHAYLN